MSFDTDTTKLMVPELHLIYENICPCVSPHCLAHNAHSAGEKFTHTHHRHECLSFWALMDAFED